MPSAEAHFLMRERFRPKSTIAAEALKDETFEPEVTMKVQGIHHITLIAEDAQRTVDFYTRVMGLRLVKRTVNFDDPGSYHLYFGDAAGSPGSILTFFAMPGVPQGKPGMGGTHHYALTVEDGAALRKWKRYLTDKGVNVNGPLDRHYFESLYFRDPEGTIVELATRGPGWTVDEPAEALGASDRQPPAQMVRANRDRVRIEADTHPEPVPAITPDMALTAGMHHISIIGSDVERTNDFYAGLLGMRLLKRTFNFDDPNSKHWYWGVDDGAPGTLITYFELDRERALPTRMGAGQAHHIALTVESDEAQLELRERMLNAGLRVSPVLDRTYFKSVYGSDPDGHIVEIATAGPGFAVDEPVAELGTRLMLPEWLEPQRGQIEDALPPLEVEPWNSHAAPARTEAQADAQADLEAVA